MSHICVAAWGAWGALRDNTCHTSVSARAALDADEDEHDKGDGDEGGW